VLKFLRIATSCNSLFDIMTGISPIPLNFMFLKFYAVCFREDLVDIVLRRWWYSEGANIGIRVWWANDFD
jgi:hypothetical protein